MDKPSKRKHRVLALLPKAAAPVNFQISPPISPRTKFGKGSVLPIVSLVPKEARRKSKNGSFDAREPGSPKISCTGQVKLKSNKMNIQRESKHVRPITRTQLPTFSDGQAKLKPFLRFNILRGRKWGDKSDSSKNEKVADESVPSLGQTKRFSSARGTLSGFDWKIHEETMEPTCLNNPLYHEKDEKCCKEETC